MQDRQEGAKSFRRSLTKTEKLHGTWLRRESKFSPSSTTVALRRRTVSLLEVGLGYCGLDHGEGSARRDSITREAFFIMGSSAIHAGALSCL